jgi:hypothetical protein
LAWFGSAELGSGIISVKRCGDVDCETEPPSIRAFITTIVR